MELFILLFLLVVLVASITGRVTDSRDYADWRPTHDGMRQVP